MADDSPAPKRPCNRKTLSIYLAGPDVFRNDAVSHLQAMKKQAMEFGFEALSPLDSEVDVHDAAITRTIFDINMEDIDKCDVVVANIDPFRGCCVDDGTAFELGAAYAKGKRIVCYSARAREPLHDRVKADFARHGEFLEAERFPLVENFPGNKEPGPANLMIVEALRKRGEGNIFETYEECLKHLAESPTSGEVAKSGA
mmetsp:Transcript_88051/g.169452  ORF Transcript_88051/g.169452 Transcript_88051/m.169452 type:complete len:200 (+) Transcript_88051:84-683(+)